MKSLILRWGLLVAGPSLAVCCIGCEKEELTVSENLTLLAPVSIMPSRATMQVGDTLWLDVNFSDSLTDYATRKRYRIRPQDVPFRTGFAIKRLIGIGQEPLGIANTVNAVAKRGRISTGGTFTGEFFLDYDGSHYRGRFGFVPTQRGVTAFSLLLSRVASNRSDIPLDFIQMPPNSQGQRRRAFLVNSYFVINDGRANNYDLYSQHTKAFANDPNLKPEATLYETQSTFTVEVK